MGSWYVYILWHHLKNFNDMVRSFQFNKYKIPWSLILFFLSHAPRHVDLVPQPRVKPEPPELKTQSLIYRMARDVPPWSFLMTEFLDYYITESKNMIILIFLLHIAELFPRYVSVYTDHPQCKCGILFLHIGEIQSSYHYFFPNHHYFISLLFWRVC